MGHISSLPGRHDFPLFDQLREGQAEPLPLHYLDNAATTQMPRQVIQSMVDFYHRHNASVHRGLYPLAEQASELYENARSTVAQFINTASDDEIIFTRSATESINMVAQGWLRPRLKSGDQVWVSRMEHHANFLPWQKLCHDHGARLRIIELNEQGELDWKNTEGLFDPSTALIALTQVSNVLGISNPTQEICHQANQCNIPVLIDAAQAVGHQSIDVLTLDCDFLAFSAHKMYGPTGIGVLYGKAQRLNEMEPLLLGGGMVDFVGQTDSQWAARPACFEAGSPNLVGAIGLASAVDFLKAADMEQIELYIAELSKQAASALSAIPGIHLYPAGNRNYSGIVSFTLEGIHPHDVAHIAGEHGVAIRAGHHCCQPLMQSLSIDSTLRASFALYNQADDIEALVNAIDQAQKIFTVEH